nr:hypothetical protein [Bacilli bacterium]
MTGMKKKKRKNLTTQWSNLYIVITLFFIVGFAFFLTSKVFIADELDILNTEIGKEHNLNSNGKFIIKDWVYDEKNNKMQVTLITSNMRSYLSELNFRAVARVNLDKELPTEVVYSSNDIYIIDIHEVPKNFQQVALRLVKKDILLGEEFEQESTENHNEEKLITSIYADERVVKRGSITERNVKDYAIQVTDEMIEESKKEIEELNNKIKNEKSVINRINEEIATLKNEIIYQTLEEQEQTNNSIYNMEKEIQKSNNTIENLELDIKSLEAKIERLEQRKRDLKYFN